MITVITGPYKRTQIAAHQQAKFYLPWQAPAAVGYLPRRRGRQGAKVPEENLFQVNRLDWRRLPRRLVFHIYSRGR